MHNPRPYLQPLYQHQNLTRHSSDPYVLRHLKSTLSFQYKSAAPRPPPRDLPTRSQSTPTPVAAFLFSWTCPWEKKTFKKIFLKNNKEIEKTKKAFLDLRSSKVHISFYSYNHRFVLHHTQGLQLHLCQATTKWKARRKTLFLTQESQEHQYRDQPSNLTESPCLGAGRGLGSHFPPLHPVEGETDAHRGQGICSSNSCLLVAELAGTGPTSLVSSSLSIAPGAIGKFVQGLPWGQCGKPFHKFAQQEIVFF